MSSRKRCAVCKQNRRISDYEPRDSIVCLNCDKRHTTPTRKEIRHNIRVATNGNGLSHASKTVAISATGGGTGVSIAATPLPPPQVSREVKVREKPCIVCVANGDSTPKLWHQFFRDSSSPDGLGDTCKSCLQKDFTVTPLNQDDGQKAVRQLKCYRCSKREGHDVLHPETDFYTSSVNKTGRQSYCIPCMKELDRIKRDKKIAAREGTTLVVQELVQSAVEVIEPKQTTLAVPEPQASQDVRVETRHVTMVPAFARAGSMILNLSNVALLDDTDPNSIEVVLNIHDINKDGTQHPRAFVVKDQDAYALRTAIQAIMGNDEQIQHMARLIKRVEDAARNETTALELASAAERQVEAAKVSAQAKEGEIGRLQAQLADALRAKELAEEKAGEAFEKLAVINNALGR